MHHHEYARAQLHRGFIERYATVQDSDYDDIRMMLEVCERANFLVLK
jgi:hypothetical protein